MKLTWAPLLCLSVASAITLEQASRAESEARAVRIQNPCSPTETWSTPSPQKTGDWLATTLSKVNRSITLEAPVWGFSEGMALRQLGRAPAQKALAEYWISRSLLRGGLIHLADSGFRALVAKPIQDATAPFQLAALGCLATIHREHPGIKIGETLSRPTAELSKWVNREGKDPAYQKILWEMGFFLFLDGHYSPEILNALKGSGPYEALSLGAYYASLDRFDETMRCLARFFSSVQGPSQVAAFFKPFLDRAHLLYARAAYSQEKYNEAIQHYQAISSSSNERVASLSELSWAYLMADKQREAIGRAIGLQSGAFRNTFAPESLMVMAMALNEMCRYPESLTAINSFRNSYRTSYSYLQGLQRRPAAGTTAESYYKTAVHFTRGQAAGVPAPVASEWIHSKVFLSNQDRINLIFKEIESSKGLSLQGKTEQQKFTVKLLNDIKDFSERYQAARSENPKGALPVELVQEMDQFKLNLVSLKHLRGAAPLWRKMLANYQARVPAMQTEMVNEINREIALINDRMRSQLEEIAENNELIEVEIYNGASDDIIWQNAHPNYKKMAEKMKTSGSHAADKVWDWGKTQGGLNGKSEVWEDEIGSLSAELYDNCESKDKYLAIERQQASEG